MVAEILNLGHEPSMRPAKIVGYSCKLWGQYPAVQDGPQGAVVTGAAYNVQTVSHGKKLADYETKNYQIKPCTIEYTDGLEPAEVMGYVFMFGGNKRDLSEGTFDLQTWLKRMGRLHAEKES